MKNLKLSPLCCYPRNRNQEDLISVSSKEANIFFMYREIDLSLEDEFKLKEHVNHLVTLDKQQLIENSMESKMNQLDFERIVKELLLDFGLTLSKSFTKKNGRELVKINIIPITKKIERNFELFIKSGLKNELESFLNKEILEAEYD